MNIPVSSTQQPGPCMEIPNGCITRGDIYRIIQELHRLFGEGYRFEPDIAVEGGIFWADYPGKTSELQHKTIRFHLMPYGKWVPIAGDKLDQWKDDETVIWKGCGVRRPFPGTFLKAFGDSTPPWTQHELRLFEHAFRVGANISFKKIPHRLPSGLRRQTKK